MAKENGTGQKIDADKIATEVGAITSLTAVEIDKVLKESVTSKQLSNQAYMKRQQARILNIVNRANAMTAPRAVAAIKKGYLEGGLKTRQWLAAFMGTPANQAFTVAEQAAVEILAQDTVNRLSDMNSTMARRANDIMKQGALQDISSINVSGEVFDKATDKFQDAIIKAGLTETETGLNLVSVNGRNYSPGPYSKMVIRTESRMAHTQGVKNKLLANDMDLVQVSSHETGDELCAEFDGNIYSITGKTPGYPILSEEPPYHPNCQHLLTPYVE